jgi:ParB family transcriptional regulator, chromosome partitioning protein
MADMQGSTTTMTAAVPKSRLGRGLAALMGDQQSPMPAGSQPQLTVQSHPTRPVDGEQRIVGIDQIRASPLNPRRDFREADLEDLANSIRQKGLIQPLIVRPSMVDGQPCYEIVAGERRWRASQRAGVHTLPVIVRDLSDQQHLELALIENVQRADLNALEEARGYRDLIERFEYTQESLSEVIGKSRSHLANMLRLLKLPEAVQALVEQGKLTAGHARCLIGREDAEMLALKVIERGLSVRDVENLVQTTDAKAAAGDIRDISDKDADTKSFETDLSNALGLKVEVKKSSGESGVLTIKYSNFDQLDYIRQRLTAQGGG